MKHFKHRAVQWTIKHRENTGRHYNDLYVNETLQTQGDTMITFIGHWLDMVYLPPSGNFVDHIFLEAQCLARILKHNSPLTMAALSCNSLLQTLHYNIFYN